MRRTLGPSLHPRFEKSTRALPCTAQGGSTGECKGGEACRDVLAGLISRKPRRLGRSFCLATRMRASSLDAREAPSTASRQSRGPKSSKYSPMPPLIPCPSDLILGWRLVGLDGGGDKVRGKGEATKPLFLGSAWPRWCVTVELQGIWCKGLFPGNRGEVHTHLWRFELRCCGVPGSALGGLQGERVVPEQGEGR